MGRAGIAGILTAAALAAWGSPAFGSEQGLFYHLHQATALLEQVSRGDCGDASGLIRGHLIEADAELGQVIMRSSATPVSPLEPATQELWELFNQRWELKVDQVEAYRLRLRERAGTMRLQHEKAWHEETAFCGAGDPLKTGGHGPAVEIDAGKRDSGGRRVTHWSYEPARFSLYSSEALDAAVFLNAVSDNPRFNARWGDLREEWLPIFAKDPAAAHALRRWSGRGIQLAYLLSALPENDLDTLLKRFDRPEALVQEIRNKLDEPAYASVLDDLEAHHAEVRVLLEFLAKNGFGAMRRKRYGAALGETQAALERTLERFDAARFADLLESFTGRKIPGRNLRVAVLVFSDPMSFQLNGFAVGWGTRKGSLDWLLAHEYMHKFNPSRENIAAQRRLAEADPFYEEAWDRVYGEFSEGKEEEFVDAAARFALLQLGLAAPIRNLRSMKLLYFSQRTGKGGAPLGAVLYDSLAAQGGLPAGFDYDRFIAGEFSSGRLRPGRFEAAFRRAVQPASGLAGMVVKEEAAGARVEKVFAGFPAQAAGLDAGDLIREVNGAPLAGLTLDEMLDALAGESGAALEVTSRGPLGDRKARLTLK